MNIEHISWPEHNLIGEPMDYTYKTEDLIEDLKHSVLWLHIELGRESPNTEMVKSVVQYLDRIARQLK